MEWNCVAVVLSAIRGSMAAMSFDYKIGELYQSPLYALRVFKTLKGIYYFMGDPFNIKGRLESFSTMQPRTIYTLLEHRTLPMNPSAQRQFVKILTIEGDVGWTCLSVPNDSKKLGVSQNPG
jgi:hypothetical protein